MSAIAISLDLSKFEASTRMRWYAVMNAWGTPADLPPELRVETDFCRGEHYRTEFPNWSAAMDLIRGSLTEQQASWGWWREQNLGDFEQWSSWFTSAHHGTHVTIDESGRQAQA